MRIENTGSCERCRAHGSTRLGREETKGRIGLLAGDKAHQYRNILLTVHFTCVAIRIHCYIFKLFRKYVSKQFNITLCSILYLLNLWL